MGLLDRLRDAVTAPPETPKAEDLWAPVRTPGPWPEGTIEAMYQSARGGEPVSPSPFVMLATATYHEPHELIRRTNPSRRAVEADLVAHGIRSGRVSMHGDSLVQRMRQRTMHQFLRSPATHLLWWDADIEALDPTCVREMLATGHDVVAGCCPIKSDERRVVINLREEDHAALVGGGRVAMARGCLEVLDVGTGFCLVSRRAIVQLCEAHPELRHFSRSDGERGEPLWALYDTGIVDDVYQSEDFMFCALWKRLGGRVYAFVRPRFRHYGIHGYEGSLFEQWGLEVER